MCGKLNDSSVSSLAEPADIATLRGSFRGSWASVEDEWSEKNVHCVGARGQLFFKYDKLD